MKNFFLRTYAKAQIARDDYGQDLIEYALVVALIAFAAIVGMQGVANQINTAFVGIGNKVSGYVT
jgi:pilus assembly protein Flp/PilA